MKFLILGLENKEVGFQLFIINISEIILSRKGKNE